jgi:hypothetical protein
VKTPIIIAVLFLPILGCGGTGGAGGPGLMSTSETGPAERQGYVEVDNGAYFDWSGFRPGTWVRTRQVQEQQGERRESVSTTRLTERSASRVVLQYGDSPASQAAFGPRTWVPASGSKGAGPEAVSKGNETLEIRGVQIPCHCATYSFEVQGSICALRSWRSREIPGAVVRTEQVWSRAGQVERTMSTQVVDWHIED